MCLEVIMHERKKMLIVLAKNGNKDALTKLIVENKRTYMEYSKKIFSKSI